MRKTHPLYAHRGELVSLVVHPDYQRLGIARRIVDELCRFAAERGLSIMEVGCRGGTPAETVYRRLGFIECGRLPGGLVEPWGERCAYDEVSFYMLLVGVSIARIYGSPLQRAVETTEIVSRVQNAPLEVSDALCEHDCGVLEGRSDKAAWEQHLAVYHQWVDEGRLEQRIEGGESYLDMQARFVPLIEGLVEAHGDAPDSLLLVAHGGLYRLMLSLALANVELAYAASHPVGYTEFVVAEARPEGLVCVNWCGEPIGD